MTRLTEKLTKNKSMIRSFNLHVNVPIQPLELTSYLDAIPEVRMPPNGDEFYNHLTQNPENSELQELSPISADILLPGCEQLANTMTHLRKLTQENPLPKDLVINAEAQWVPWRLV